MVEKKTVWRGWAAAVLSVGLSASAPGAFAGEWEFTLSGVFNGTTDNPATGMGNPLTTETISGSGAPNLTTNEPFTLTAVFNSSNVVLYIPGAFDAVPGSGFAAYGPQWVTLSVGGQTYGVQTYDQNNTTGLTVALFDQTSVFSGTGPNASDNHFGAGFIQNPVADGAGIVGDWLASTPPNFLVSNLVDTQWTTDNNNYFGAGFQSGPCPTAGYYANSSGICALNGSDAGPFEANAVVPIPLSGGLSLTLAQGGYNNYDLNNAANLTLYPAPPGTFPNPNINLFSASLTAVPEPSTWALLLVGFAGFAGVAAARGRKFRNARRAA